MIGRMEEDTVFGDNAIDTMSKYDSSAIVVKWGSGDLETAAYTEDEVRRVRKREREREREIADENI